MENNKIKTLNSKTIEKMSFEEILDLMQDIKRKLDNNEFSIDQSFKYLQIAQKLRSVSKKKLEKSKLELKKIQNDSLQ